ncbi:hypothetical protein [Butyrivibrio sp. INlla21]|uniref:hypothetical protein n=1 Tax=Butyrivibrio sp. INlla21 TaxID=1520811 RepID=UPI0008E605A6|nr:hypothetical protein [Butyrivibrio sp. INlla21]SFU57267.1 hypothetical protein SAMN02910342_00935 [Butyrivibrio sp. INlla21]
MKIHDKFVIELREVIKGYGNDPTVQDPCKFPCDYKFYEIGGVAICEESFKKMKPLESEINAVLDKLRAEIKAKIEQEDFARSVFRHEEKETAKAEQCTGSIFAYKNVLKLIDKYKSESEVEDGND